ncbi:MAG: hypothetical protein K2M50_06230 [Treponemataceae bacterium]|nr:hypothetical protein [Treponemataceae bacterium]
MSSKNSSGRFISFLFLIFQHFFLSMTNIYPVIDKTEKTLDKMMAAVYY